MALIVGSVGNMTTEASVKIGRARTRPRGPSAVCRVGDIILIEFGLDSQKRAEDGRNENAGWERTNVGREPHRVGRWLQGAGAASTACRTRHPVSDMTTFGEG